MTSVYPRARIEGLHIKDLGDETMVYDKWNNSATCLNPIGVAIWNACDGETSVESLKSSVQQAGFQDVSDEAIGLALRQLKKVALVDFDGELPQEMGRYTNRRDLLRGLGISAVAAVPVVTMIKVPPAVAQSSQGVTECDGGGNEGVGNCLDAYPGTLPSEWRCTAGVCGNPPTKYCIWDGNPNNPPAGYVGCPPA